MSRRTIRVVDLFCGAGGSSSGMKRAARRLGRRLHMTVINHWECAVKTHTANHPDVEHLCDSLEEIDPREVVSSGRLDLLWASPECIGFSNAAGGVPRSEQSRTGAWHVRDWAKALNIPLIIIENIREFQKWKPLTRKGRPDRRYRDGHTFRQWILAMEGLGYRAAWRMLRSADYGDPTTRERLFIVLRKGRAEISWPRPTHLPRGGGGRRKWVPARKIIDWSTPGESIFNRRKPLRPKTIERIAAGLRKFGGPLAEPFLIMLYGTGSTRSIKRPLPTVTAKGQHVGLCEPFLIPQQSGGAPRSTRKPVPTISTAGAISMVEPFLVNYHGDHAGRTDGERRVQDIKKPLPTQDTSNRYGLCEPHVTILKGRSVARSVDKPLPTITSQNCHALIEPFLVKYNGTAKAVSVDEPLHTVSTKARFGLVEINGERYRLDIRFRMLLVKELALAMGFDPEYKFSGTKADQIRQIGNAVSVGLAGELCYCNLSA